MQFIWQHKIISLSTLLKIHRLYLCIIGPQVTLTHNKDT
jgi:hypothetical protein